MLKHNLSLKPFLFYITVAFILFSCSEKPYEGVVGNYYTISVDAPKKVENPSFSWSIIQVPENSLLTFSDLIVSDSGNEVTFNPDDSGEYRFEVVIFDEDGDEVASEIYTFIIESPPVTEAQEVEEEELVEYDVEEPETSVVPLTEPVVEEYKEDVTETTEIALETLPESEDIPTSQSPSQTPQKPLKEPFQKEPVRGRDIPKVPDQFTIQYSSWKSLEDAQREVESLLAIGFDAYVQKAYFSETDEIWFRVRIGRFSSQTSATIATKEIETITNKKAWVDNIRVEY